MIDTNSPTYLAAQQLAAQSGFNISGTEIGLLVTVGGGVVHVLHQLAGAWGKVGGWYGFKQWFDHGDKVAAPPAPLPPPPGT